MRRTSGKSTQKALIFIPYRNAPKFSLNRPRLSFSSCRCIIFASRSAMLSLNSAKAGSREFSGKSELACDMLPLGVVWLARKLVRDGGLRGVVGRDGTRVRECDELRCRPLEGGWPAGVVVVAISRFPVELSAARERLQCLFIPHEVGRRVETQTPDAKPIPRAAPLPSCSARNSTHQQRPN